MSRNLCTQFAKQLSSPREKRFEGVPVMHLMSKMLTSIKCEPCGALDVLIPAYRSKVLNGRVQPSLLSSDMFSDMLRGKTTEKP